MLAIPGATVAVLTLSGDDGAKVPAAVCQPAGPQPGPPPVPLILASDGRLNLNGHVRHLGRFEPWREVIRATPGDVVQWRLRVGNYNSTRAHTNAVVRNVLPPYVEVIPESVRFVSASGGDQQPSDAPLFDSATTGGVGTRETAHIKFATADCSTTSPGVTCACGTTRRSVRRWGTSGVTTARPRSLSARCHVDSPASRRLGDGCAGDARCLTPSVGTPGDVPRGRVGGHRKMPHRRGAQPRPAATRMAPGGRRVVARRPSLQGHTTGGAAVHS